MAILFHRKCRSTAAGDRWLSCPFPAAGAERSLQRMLTPVPSPSTSQSDLREAAGVSRLTVPTEPRKLTLRGECTLRVSSACIHSESEIRFTHGEPRFCAQARPSNHEEDRGQPRQ